MTMTVFKAIEQGVAAVYDRYMNAPYEAPCDLFPTDAMCARCGRDWGSHTGLSCGSAKTTFVLAESTGPNDVNPLAPVGTPYNPAEVWMWDEAAKPADPEPTEADIKAKEDALLEELLSKRGLMAVAIKDGCTVCHGERGGVPGNENVVDGQVMCDYCTADHHNTTPRGLLMVAAMSGRLGTGDV